MILLRKLPIGLRLAAAFTVLALGLVAVAGVGPLKLHSLKTESRHIDQRQVPVIALAGELAANQGRASDQLSRLLFADSGRTAQQDAARRTIKALDARDTAIADRLGRELAGTAAEGELNAYRAVDTQVDTLRSQILAAGPTAARGLFQTQMEQLGRRLDTVTAGLITAAQDEVGATVAHEEADAG